MTTDTNGQPATNGTHLKTHRDSGCFAKLFQNEGRYGPYVTLSIGRTFVDAASGEFQDTTNFSRTQGLKLMGVLQAALEDAKDIEAELTKAKHQSDNDDADGASSAASNASNEAPQDETGNQPQ